MPRILMVEDSRVVATLLRAIFDAEPDFEVVGHALNGKIGVEMAERLKPDVVTMDIRMPEMDGFEATRMIMATNPVPIVVVSSSVDDDELRITFRAIEEGALAVIEKPRGLRHPDFESIRSSLVRTVRAMSEVPVVTRRAKLRRRTPGKHIFQAVGAPEQGAPLVVAIGSSTGGPQALQQILGALPRSFPLPIVVTQHISPGFVGGLAKWLGGSCMLDVQVAAHGQPLAAGRVHIAPDHHHMLVVREGPGLAVALDEGPAVGQHRPSVTSLFESVALSCANRAVGGLLTGMGVDGAAGLLMMRRAGGHTFAQDEASSIVHGMPGAAISTGAAIEVISLERVAKRLIDLVGGATLA